MTELLRSTLHARRLNVALTIRILIDDYPIGSEVKWFGGGKIATGIVIRHNAREDKLQVRSRAGNRKRWITAQSIVDAMPEPFATG